MAWRCRFLAARPSQDGRVIAEKRLSEELSGAPDALVDFHTVCDELGADLGSPHCGRGRFVGFAGATKLAPFAARAFSGGFRMDTCSEFWFSPFPDFDHKRELRSMNLTHYSLLRTAR